MVMVAVMVVEEVLMVKVVVLVVTAMAAAEAVIVDGIMVKKSGSMSEAPIPTHLT